MRFSVAQGAINLGTKVWIDQSDKSLLCFAWQVVSLMKNEQQSQKLLLEVDQRSTFRNTFLQPATNVFQIFGSSTRNKCFCCQVGRVSWKRKVKNGKHGQKLATKQCCGTSWRFLYLVFRRLKARPGSGLDPSLHLTLSLFVLTMPKEFQLYGVFRSDNLEKSYRKGILS